MSNSIVVNHDMIGEHLAKVKLQPNDFAILGVRPTDNPMWFQVAVAQHIPRDNDQATPEVTSAGRKRFGRGKGDPNWGQSKALRHWDTLTLEDIKLQYKDVPEVIEAAEACVQAKDYVLVSDENGNPIVNPMYEDTDGTKYKFNLDMWEDHMVETEWDVNNITSSAKQDGNGNYLFKNYGGELVNGNYQGGKNYAIFRHFDVVAGEPRREPIKHDGAVRDVKVLKLKTPDTTGGGIAGLPGIAGTAEDAQKQNKPLVGDQTSQPQG